MLHLRAAAAALDAPSRERRLVRSGEPVIWIHAKRALRWSRGKSLPEVAAYFDDLPRRIRAGEPLPDWVSLTEPQ
jgi:hypothetical protein